MLKPSPQLCGRLRRLQLTTKQTNKGYYKGNRTGSMGRHTKHGKYVIDNRKVRTYRVPDLSNFMLTPFVTARVKKPIGTFDKKVFAESSMKDTQLADPALEEKAEDTSADEDALRAPHEKLGGRLNARRYLAMWKTQNAEEFDIIKNNRKS